MFKTSKSPGILYSACVGVLVWSTSLAAQSPEVRHITLAEAQARASNGQVASLAQFGVDAAKYHRQSVQADYFPKIDSTFWNLHFNKFMGQRIQLFRRDASLPLLGKDQTIFVATLTQPVTPLFKVRQAVGIARADEEIAKAKGAQLAAQAAANVERIYFALLIAQRQQSVAVIKTNMAERQNARLNSGADLVTARSLVTELTRSLNTLIGFEPDTELELASPEPEAETTSLSEATQQAVANSPEVVEALQTVVKARAATRLSKLEYVPDVAIIGGYAFQTVIPAVPDDLTFIGFMATFNIFDFGKREKTISERQAQLNMAVLNVDVVKSKVAASAQRAVLELQRKRQIRDLTRRLAAAYHAVPVSYQETRMESQLERVQAEADMFQAELDYRMAYSELKRVIEGR